MNDCERLTNYYNRLNRFLFRNGSDPGAPPILPENNDKTSKTIHLDNKILEKSRWLFNELNLIQERHPNLIKNIIIQGSYGDFTTTAYSDLDLVLFLQPAVLPSRRKRLALKKVTKHEIMPFIYKVDPLQHHGFFTLWDAYLHDYTEEQLPHIVYKKAWGLKKQELTFKIRNRRMPDRVLGLLDTIIKEYKAVVKWKNFYFYKQFTSHILILPCVYFSSKGISIDKPNSFEPFLAEFKYLSHSINLASSIRNTWPQVPGLVKWGTRTSLGYRIFGRRLPIICGFFYKKADIQQRIEEIDIEDFINLKKAITREVL